MKTPLLFSAVFSSFAIFAAGCFSPRAPLEDSGISERDLAEAIEKISFNRGIAESFVEFGLRQHRNNLNRIELIRKKYERASSQGNAFIDKLQLSLTLRKIDGDALAADVRKVATAVNELYEATETLSLEPGKPIASGVGQLISLDKIDSITKSALSIVKAAQDREDKLVENIKKELDKQRWKSWNSFPQPT
jgi:hypothetical protein